MTKYMRWPHGQPYPMHSGQNGTAPSEAGTPGADGAPGAAGADGATWLSGAGAPGPTIGDNGDFYLDTTASAWYGPKAAGSWAGTGPHSLVGPDGGALWG